MSGLTKKIIYTDKTLSDLLNVKEGSLVSYAEISRGLHKYIKEKDLKNPKSTQVRTQAAHAAPVAPAESVMEKGTTCRDCGEAIPSGAVFCDTCGMRQ